MSPIGTPPKRETLEARTTDTWFRNATERFRIQVVSTNPTTDTIPQGEWGVFYNTTAAQLRLWANYNGTLKSVTLT